MPGLEPYMQGVESMPNPKQDILPRVKIRLFRPAPRGRQIAEDSNLLATAFAHRRDKTVSAAEVEGVVTFVKQRQYVLLRDIRIPISRPEGPESLGREELGTEALGNQPVPQATKVLGAQAAKGLLVEDTETGQTYTISGLTRDPVDRLVVIHCEQERTF